MKQFKYKNFYVVESNHESSFDQISVRLDSFQEAVDFKNNEYISKKHPSAFVICSLTKK